METYLSYLAVNDRVTEVWWSNSDENWNSVI